MRQRVLLVLVLIGSWSVAIAQSDRLRFETPIVTKAFESGSGDDVATPARILNPTSRPVRARWIREVTELPGGWTLAISDGTNDHGPRVDSADFLIPAYGSAPVTPHLSPGLGTGNAQVTIRVFDIQNRRNYATATFRYEQATPARPSAGVRLFPNPGDDEFRVSSDVVLSRVTLTNMLGKQVKVFNGMLATYDVSDLPNGVYLVGLYGLDGRAVKTLRFSKRTARP